MATPVPTTVTVPSPTTTQAAATTTQAPPPPALSAVAMQRTVAVANGQVRVQVTVANTGNSTANGVRVDLPAPTGAALFRSLGVATPAASLVSAYGSGWTCNSTGSCTLLALAAGQSSVLQLTFALSPSVGSSITFTPTISAPIGAAVSTTPVTVAVGAVNGLLAAETERGAVVAIGNSVTTCADTDPRKWTDRIVHKTLETLVGIRPSVVGGGAAGLCHRSGTHGEYKDIYKNKLFHR